MKKQDVILDFEDVFNTYKTRIPKKQLEFLRKAKWFPINRGSRIAEEFSYLVGKVMGDGHIDKKFSTHFIGQKEEVQNIKSYLKEYFGINKNITIIKRKACGISHSLRVNYSIFGRTLYSLGAPKSNKVKQEFLIPKWIVKSKKCSKKFLQGILEDELSTIKIKISNCSNGPMLKMAKNKEHLNNLRDFLIQIRKMLQSHNIECSNVSSKHYNRNDQKTRELYFTIRRNKENIIKFSKSIGFRYNTKKKCALEKCIEILKKTRYNRKPIIEKDRIIKLRKQGHSIRKIGHIVNLNSSSVHRVIKECGDGDSNSGNH